MTPLELLNLSLLKIGNSAGIVDIDEATRQAYTGRQVYDHTLRATLRAFPWPFATKYAALYITQGPATWTDPLVQAWDAAYTYLVGDAVVDASVVYWANAQHLNQQPPNASYWDTDAPDRANGDWLYAYRWPDDCLFARRLVSATFTGRTFSDTPIPFRIGRDKNGLLVYTNEAEAVLEYTTLDCDALFMDDLFVDSFTWRLASYLAPALSRDDKMSIKAYGMYLQTLDRKSVV